MEDLAVRSMSTSDRLAELYEAHVGSAERLAAAITGDTEVGRDLAHEAFVRIAGRFGHLRDENAFEGYLRRTVVNLCRAHFRRLYVHRAWLMRQDPGAPAVGPPATELRDELWAAILLLPYRQRAAVVLRFLEDMTEEQTAQLLHCSPRAVNALVSRAMARLREHVRRER